MRFPGDSITLFFLSASSVQGNITMDPRLTLNWFPLSSAVLLRLRINNDSQSETLTDSSFMVFTFQSAAVPSSSLLRASLFTSAGLLLPPVPSSLLLFSPLLFFQAVFFCHCVWISVSASRFLGFKKETERQAQERKTSSFYLFINLFTRTFMFV